MRTSDSVMSQIRVPCSAPKREVKGILITQLCNMGIRTEGEGFSRWCLFFKGASPPYDAPLGFPVDPIATLKIIGIDKSEELKRAILMGTNFP